MSSAPQSKAFFFTFGIGMLLVASLAKQTYAQTTAPAINPDSTTTPAATTATDTTQTAADTSDNEKKSEENTEKNSENPSATPNTPAPTPLGAGQSFYQTPAREQKLLQTFTQGPLGSGESILLTANEQEFIALWHSDTSGDPKGAALILPDENITPLANQSVRNLQTYLSQHGWSTLTIALPKTYKALPPPASPIIEVKNSVPKEPATEEAAEAPSKKEADIVYDGDKEAAETEADNAKNTADDANPTKKPEEQQPLPPPEPPPPTEPVAQAQLQAALSFLQEKGQANIVVIAQGIGSARALFYLEQTIFSLGQTTAESANDNKAPINALIMLDAKLQITELANWDAYGIIAKLPFPTLDITHAPHSQSPEMAATITTQKRRIAAQVGKVAIYEQRQLLPETLTSQEMRMTRVIRGFLKKYLESKP